MSYRGFVPQQNDPRSGTDVEELVNDSDFFSDMQQASSGDGISNRKRNRQLHEMEQVMNEAPSAEDEVTRNERAAEARKKIAAAVLARASPREVRQAIKNTQKGEIATSSRRTKERANGSKKRRKH
ncbi:hypothetical protein ERJ75_001728700 [Trypanosoma vivax]|uniref:Uncharacterized protein n=1 Tax=Trypanosoma vivax (strain Y486) TaxID=1055687 RepID=G0U3A5_TRYVY|nr:hypothetical protein TRVL_00920 [Trypanosoma vivax]KAH8604091.1 hypothetical protein ERJ75_001728700 [Trypanosoma vivax]CCC50761.1 conserved hypothetical protein [Trypanosoma vivax Y486]